MTPAAIYCRSSKDRAEVGLAAQRAELKTFAESKGLSVAEEFSDMEISGSLDETSRPGLRKLLGALNDPLRQWKTILALDTSRIARDPMLALYITHEAEKRGVSIHYAKMPVDSTSAFGETMLSVVRAFDRLHARLSAEKGRGGLVANVEQGFRAGGRAPYGYRLKHEATGGMRGGVAVRKSTLVPDSPAAERVKVFLEARAAGVARHEAAKRARLQQKATASLIGIERNALTYAGYTVWNVRRKVKPTREDPRKRMDWRPRTEWQISEAPTHEGLITRAEAERILAAVDVANPKARTPQAKEPEKFILSGLLFTPDDKQWTGDSHDSAYRAGMRGQRIKAAFVEGIVLAKIALDLADGDFLKRAVAEARRMAEAIEADPQALDVEIKRQEKRLANLLDLAADAAGGKAVLVKIAEMETAIETLRAQRAEWAERKALKEQLLGITQAQLAKLTHFMNPNYVSRPQMRNLISSVVERIVLDPKTREFEIRYRLPITGAGVASPRGCDLYSGTLALSSVGRIVLGRLPRGHVEPAHQHWRGREEGNADIATVAAGAATER